MASAAEERALALIAKAEKKLNGMFSFGNGKYEEAAEMYGQAAKQYQLGKQCESRPLPPPGSWGSPRNMLTSRCGQLRSRPGATSWWWRCTASSATSSSAPWPTRTPAPCSRRPTAPTVRSPLRLCSPCSPVGSRAGVPCRRVLQVPRRGQGALRPGGPAVGVREAGEAARGDL